MSRTDFNIYYFFESLAILVESVQNYFVVYFNFEGFIFSPALRFNTSIWALDDKIFESRHCN